MIRRILGETIMSVKTAMTVDTQGNTVVEYIPQVYPLHEVGEMMGVKASTADMTRTTGVIVSIEDGDSPLHCLRIPSPDMWPITAFPCMTSLAAFAPLRMERATAFLGQLLFVAPATLRRVIFKAVRPNTYYLATHALTYPCRGTIRRRPFIFQHSQVTKSGTSHVYYAPKLRTTSAVSMLQSLSHSIFYGSEIKALRTLNYNRKAASGMKITHTDTKNIVHLGKHIALTDIPQLSLGCPFRLNKQRRYNTIHNGIISQKMLHHGALMQLGERLRIAEARLAALPDGAA